MAPLRTVGTMLALVSIPFALACSAETSASSGDVVGASAEPFDAGNTDFGAVDDTTAGSPEEPVTPESPGSSEDPGPPGEPGAFERPEGPETPDSQPTNFNGVDVTPATPEPSSDSTSTDNPEQDHPGPKLPGRVQVEDYDRYSDATAGNSGAACRNDDVDLEISSDEDGTCNVGWTEAGEWLEYDVSITTRGNYDLVARAAGFAGTIHVELDGSDLTGPITVDTGGWQKWRDFVVPHIALPVGDHTLRITFDGKGTNLNYFEFVEAATPSADSDGDGLSDDVETNTRVFVGPNDTGTDPFDPDTDGDGISDGDESLGTKDGLDLPALGTNPLRKNILLEYDWFDDDNECSFHSHRPTGAMIFDVTEAFANAPVENPDGSTGITLIHDYGQGGAFTGGNLIPDEDGLLTGKVADAEFQNHKKAHFAPDRLGYFHYVILPHRFDTNSSSSGQAGFRDDDMIVSLYCFYDNRRYVAYTIMHELGHNLNLRHGGNDDVNDKPNYNSVMNYQFQFQGIDNTCDGRGDYVLDYSSGTRPPLDESSLDERAGVCGRHPDTRPFDWNANDTFDSKLVSHDINGDSYRTTLRDYDDWANIVYDWDSTDAGAGLAVPESTPEVVDCQSVPPLP